MSNEQTWDWMSPNYIFAEQCKAIADGLPALTAEQRDVIAMSFRGAHWPTLQGAKGGATDVAA